MSFIPGRFLNPGVTQQINTRQDILGNRERLMQDGANPEAFTFFSKKVPFIKLTSAIDVNGSTELAKKFTLDNGVFSAKQGDIPGYELTNDLGYRPQPGITDMQLNTHNRFGSLRTATVSFEVHSVDQLDQYEQLFMRPGYSALLEWGNSYYLDNASKEVREVNELLSDRFLSKEGLPSKLSIYTAIDELRTKYSYNYDAMYGLLKNFRWSIRPDGGYSCTVDLVSVGTIIESLNIGTGIPEAEIKKYLELKRSLGVTGQVTNDPTEDPGATRTFLGAEVNAAELNEQYAGISIPILKKDLSAGEESLIELLKQALPEEILTSTLLRPLTTLGKSPGRQFYEFLPDTLTFRGVTASQPVPGDFGEIIDNVLNVFGVDTDFGEFPPYTDDIFYTTFKDGYEADVRFNDGDIQRYRISIVGEPEFEQATVTSQSTTGGSSATYGYYKFTFKLDEVESIAPSDTPVEDVGLTQNALSADNKLLQIFRDSNAETDSSLHLILDKIRKRSIKTTPSKSYVEFSGTSIFAAERLVTEYTTLLYRSELTIDTEESGSPSTATLTQPTSGLYYIQLGAFLTLLNKYIPSTKTSASDAEPLLQLHASKSVVHRHKTLENLHASIDIGKFILPESQESGDKLVQRGDILDIFVGIGYLEEIVRQKLRDGELKIYELVTGILKDLEIALGGINSFELQYFENTFKFHVIDRELIDPSEFTENPLVRLELIGKNSTLLNLNLTSKLSPAIGSQLAIAAQADPVSNGIEGTGWAKFNKNLKDRYIPEKEVDLEKLFAAQEKKEQELQKKLARVFLFLDATYYRQTIGATGIDIPSVATEYAVLCKILLNNEVKAGKDFGTIIPYELNLELEGMSGFEVMRSFIINEQIIPKVYRNEEEGIAFLITGLTHKVSAERWTVSIKAQIYNTNTKGLASVKGKLNLKGNNRTENTEVLGETSDTNYNPVLSRVSTNTTQEELASKINSAIPNEPEAIRAGVLFLARQEQNLKGFNHNYYGVMADIGRWTGGDTYFNGSFSSTEGAAGQGIRTSNIRYFASFGSDEDGIKFIANTLKRKRWQSVTDQNIASTYYKTWLGPADPDALIARDNGRKGRLWKEVLTSIRTA